MSKIARKEPEYAQVNFLKHIEAQKGWMGLAKDEVFAGKMGVSAPTVRAYKKNPGVMKVETLQRVIKLLDLSPAVVLRYLGFSQKDINRALREPEA